MRYLLRPRPAGLIGLVLGVSLALSGCTGGNAAAPTSEAPLTPGSLVDETPSSTPPIPSSLPASTPTTSSVALGSTTILSSDAETAPTSAQSVNSPATASVSRPVTVTESSRTVTSLNDTATDGAPSTASGSTTSPSSAATIESTESTSRTTTPKPPSSISRSSSATPSRSTGVETVHLTPEELTTRKEIEKAWLKYWSTFTLFNKIPKVERRTRFAEVAMDPELSSLLAAAERADQENLENFGTVSHRVYWGPPVAGKGSAVIGDCTDQTQFGAKNKKTGEIVVIGGKQGNYNGTMQKTGSSWKVSYLDFRGESC